MHWNPPPPELFSLSMQAALRQQGKLQPHSLLAVTGIHLLVCKSMSKTHLTPQLPLKPLNTHTHKWTKKTTTRTTLTLLAVTWLQLSPVHKASSLMDFAFLNINHWSYNVLHDVIPGSSCELSSLKTRCGVSEENKYGKLNRNLHIQQNIHKKIKQALTRSF